MSKRNSHEAKQARREQRLTTKPITETHEPSEPLPDWPKSHVNVFQTGDDIGECIAIKIHGITHYLHASTAEAMLINLRNELQAWDEHAKSHGTPGLEIEWDRF
jgi:hypothetical protein